VVETLPASAVGNVSLIDGVRKVEESMKKMSN
jgi:hypothetical protein